MLFVFWTSVRIASHSVQRTQRQMVNTQRKAFPKSRKPFRWFDTCAWLKPRLSKPEPKSEHSLEMKADLRRESARRNVVRSTKRREEVVQRIFIGDIYSGQTQAPFVLIAVEEVVLTD